MKQVDYLVVGAGIVGLATAYELKQRFPEKSVLIVEKEATPAEHQSGHNSGVIHAGVYYAPGSLKARFCKEGAEAIRSFAQQHNIHYEDCGKLIVATSNEELQRMQKLAQRARQNGIVIEDVSAAQLATMEPNINGLGAIYSPNTGIIDFKQVSQKMAQVLLQQGAQIQYQTSVIGAQELSDKVIVDTTNGPIQAGQVVTCAGLHADRLIKQFGHKPGFQVVPFRGEFFRLLNQPYNLVQHLIYPVPDPERPFLGVHLTRKLNGAFTVGPNAVLAMSREGYKRTDISLKDLLGTLTFTGFWRMLVSNARSAVSELSASLSKRVYLKRVQKYYSKLSLSDLIPYPAGVRAQAVADDGSIIDDFLFVETERCLHVGNAPSPAATSCIPIARHIVDRIHDGK